MTNGAAGLSRNIYELPAISEYVCHQSVEASTAQRIDFEAMTYPRLFPAALLTRFTAPVTLIRNLIIF